LLLKFSGNAVAGQINYLADEGVDPGVPALQHPVEYPYAGANLPPISRLSARIHTAIPANSSLTVNVRVDNGGGPVTVGSTTFIAGEPAGTTHNVGFSPVLIGTGNLIDVQTTNTGLISVPTGVSATVTS
jgi:hypothetical protein